jgi:hypothetical protein
VLPTSGHRWIANRQDAGPVFDCEPADESTLSLTWLLQVPVTFAPNAADCADPLQSDQFARGQYRYVIARTGVNHATPASSPRLSVVAVFPDSRVYVVAPGSEAIVTDRVDGFYPIEHDAVGHWWRWMGRESRWTVRNVTDATQHAALSLRLRAAGASRDLLVTLDGTPAGRVTVTNDDHDVEMPALTLAPGTHVLVLTAVGDLVRPSEDGRSTDTRELSVMLTAAGWISPGSAPAR